MMLTSAGSGLSTSKPEKAHHRDLGTGLVTTLLVQLDVCIHRNNLCGHAVILCGHAVPGACMMSDCVSEGLDNWSRHA